MAEAKAFFTNMGDLVTQGFQDIDRTKQCLVDEIKKIGELETKTTETTSYIELDGIPELRDTVIESVKRLIEDCKAYRKRHLRNQ